MITYKTSPSSKPNFSKQGQKGTADVLPSSSENVLPPADKKRRLADNAKALVPVNTTVVLDDEIQSIIMGETVESEKSIPIYMLKIWSSKSRKK